MDEFETKVESEIERIETSEGVRVVYAVESGSRAWGFASPDSDYDVRFLYVRPLCDYVRLTPLRDVIELPIDTTLANPFDLSGWDILKALALFRSSNPPLLEWLHSPIIYREEGDLAVSLRRLAVEHYSQRRMGYHYLSMARKTYQEHLAGRTEVSLKKYLYALRPLLCVRWLEEFGTPPPTLFTTTLAQVSLANDLRHRLSELLERKRGRVEKGLEPVDALLMTFIETELERQESSVRELLDPRMPEEPLNALLWAQTGVPLSPVLKEERNHGN